ncbi:MAG: putative polyhydroxyalkanoic acid system protein gran rgn [Bryobacterales bacterium]|jgi:hypothetical protein|nr:putative polyhydroxyalkanoic acid system protein gran rgn [Bryobacterales bacterium]
MTIIIPHHKTKQEVVARIDKATDDLFANGIGGSIQIVNPTKEWTGSTMKFSVTGRMGFITVPISGDVAVDDVNVTVHCELPSMLKSFLGETKVQAGIEKKFKEIVSA